MNKPNAPSFEEWVEYCFTQGYDNWASGDDDESTDRHERFVCLESSVITAYLTRLFESPEFLGSAYSPEQIANAMWFIFGCASEYLKDVRYGNVGPGEQIRCIRSVATLYTDLLDRVCGDRGRDPDTDLRERSKIDGAVYMIWDMDSLEGTVMFHEKHPHLVEPGLFVLESVLQKCRTSACRVSALHGIGHCLMHGPSESDEAVTIRLREFVDRFVASTPLPDWLAEYAACARDGYVQ